ncbi:MAG: DUF58 domain-containing protein [Synergistaceae bacterium]|nr:DUF58 domain-containing protein [Synergistaceae bacterium]
MIPTKRAAAIFSMSIPLALVIVSAWRELWYASFCYPALAAIFMMADAVSSLPSNRLKAALQVPKRLCVGRPKDAVLTLDAGGFGFPVLICARLELTGEADAPADALGELAGGACSMRLRVAPKRRGRIGVAAVWLKWSGPMGLMETRRRQAVGEGIDVIPDVNGIPSEALRYMSRDAEYGEKTSLLKGVGTEFEDLCDFEPGMDHRLIDWKSSARHRKALCKEYRDERNHHVVLGFDTGRLMLEPANGMPKIDQAIRAGLLLGWSALRNGDFLGGCGFDAAFRNYIKPGRGMRHFTRFQRFTSDLSYRTEETNFTLAIAELNTRLSRRALVVLFTEFADPIQAELLIESLGWMARRHAVIFVTMRDAMLASLQNAPPENFRAIASAVVSGDFLRERRIVLERVSRLGIHCLDVPAGAVPPALLNRYMMIKRRGLL